MMAEPSAFEAEGDQLVVPAIGAAQAKEVVGKGAALEKGVELALDELRQALGPREVHAARWVEVQVGRRIAAAANVSLWPECERC